tara:strand:+ start:167 stop:499 length:333 start_codon:yes stop_codon:yes gene_type:complete
MYKFILLLTIVIISGCTSLPINTQTIEGFQAKIKTCNLLKNIKHIQDCKDDALLKQAIGLDDKSYCEYASNAKSSNLCKNLFYLDKAEKTQKSAFCGFITDKIIKDICLN